MCRSWSGRIETHGCDDAPRRHLCTHRVVSQRRRRSARRGPCHPPRNATQFGEDESRAIDSALYTMGNVLLRAISWSASDVADQLEDLVVICGPPLAMSTEWLRLAAVLGDRHRITFYDAAWAVTADALGISFVSVDAQLRTAGLAESPAEVGQRLRLSS